MRLSALVLVFPRDELGGELLTCVAVDVQASRGASGLDSESLADFAVNVEDYRMQYDQGSLLAFIDR